MMKKHRKSLLPKVKVVFIKKMTLFLDKSLITKEKANISIMMYKLLIPKDFLARFYYVKLHPPYQPPARAAPLGRLRAR